MKNIIIILVLSFNVSFSQTDSTNEALKYYPLNIGDYWQYQIGKSSLGDHSFTKIDLTSFEILGDTVWGNGKKYFYKISKGLDVNIMSFLSTQFLRIDSTNGIVYGNNGIGNEFIVDSLLASINDTVQNFIIHNISIKNILGSKVETKECIPSWTSAYDFYNWEFSKNSGLTNSYYGDATQNSYFHYSSPQYSAFL